MAEEEITHAGVAGSAASRRLRHADQGVMRSLKTMARLRLG